MKIPFYKYQGAGNDFVMIDNRTTQWISKDDQQSIAHFCDRRFGVGADGLILLQDHTSYGLEMVYFNADGKEGSMCGNGGRCFVAFAHHLGIVGESCQFIATDGPHAATIKEQGNWVELKMIDVEQVQSQSNHFTMNTGSPHYVQFVEDIDQLNVVEAGRAIRYSERFSQEGINVNFIAPSAKEISIATYERGVEDETLACGTGVTAAAIAFFIKEPIKAVSFLRKGGIPIKAKGGDLKVRFEVANQQFRNIWLCGPAAFVFKGEIEVIGKVNLEE